MSNIGEQKGSISCESLNTVIPVLEPLISNYPLNRNKKEVGKTNPFLTFY